MNEVNRSSIITFSKKKLFLNDVQISPKSTQLLLNFEKETTTDIRFEFQNSQILNGDKSDCLVKNWMMEVSKTGPKESWKSAKKWLKDGQKTELRQPKIIWKLDQWKWWVKEDKKLYNDWKLDTD